MAEEVHAADLPDWSVVAGDHTCWIKSHPTRYVQWAGTNGGYFENWYIDDRLAKGAQLLRRGNGPPRQRSAGKGLIRVTTRTEGE